MRLRENGIWLIEAEVFAFIVQHALRDYPEEACGILFGREENAGWIQKAQPVTNMTARNRSKRYLIDPLDLLQADRSAEEKGFTIWGFYHSHPDHPAVPSGFDLGSAWADYLYLIIAVQKAAFQQAKAWMLNQEKDGFVEVRLSCGPAKALVK